MKFSGKFIVVTGASTGIGRSIAVKFAKEGAFVALIGRARDKLLETKGLIAKENGNSEIFLCDLTNLDSIENLTASIKRKTGQIDALINVAGVWHGKDEVYANKKFVKISQKVILDTYFVSVVAPTLLAHAFIPLMPKNGKILNISGTFESGARGWLPYYVSKRAIEDLTVGLAEELKDKNIQVNAISPSDTATEAYKKYFPQYAKDTVKPEKIAEYAVHLCSEESNKVTGKVFVVAKGQKPYEGFHK